jgi:hypothetical protein
MIVLDQTNISFIPFFFLISFQRNAIAIQTVLAIVYEHNANVLVLPLCLSKNIMSCIFLPVARDFFRKEYIRHVCDVIGPNMKGNDVNCCSVVYGGGIPEKDVNFWNACVCESYVFEVTMLSYERTNGCIEVSSRYVLIYLGILCNELTRLTHAST